ncbi:hypothetical protein COU76_01145 [Candidatus Peregrinibacteria bacterium CG10_big_fil_rev_8_21_14_0_10_49_10]|nr:MAG: hypothetical protein COU76_01145 [Candidatus Peregrinibacteria bacterium CG10_big_fil_rev_8_21_14_0_10_49_10]
MRDALNNHAAADAQLESAADFSRSVWSLLSSVKSDIFDVLYPDAYDSNAEELPPESIDAFWDAPLQTNMAVASEDVQLSFDTKELIALAEILIRDYSALREGDEISVGLAHERLETALYLLQKAENWDDITICANMVALEANPAAVACFEGRFPAEKEFRTLAFRAAYEVVHTQTVLLRDNVNNPEIHSYLTPVQFLRDAVRCVEMAIGSPLDFESIRRVAEMFDWNIPMNHSRMQQLSAALRSGNIAYLLSKHIRVGAALPPTLRKEIEQELTQSEEKDSEHFMAMDVFEERFIPSE